MKKIITGVLCSISLLTLTACVQNTNTANGGVETIKIGIIAPLSGPAAPYGEDVVHVYDDSVSKFNAAHSGDIQIQLIYEDGRCEGNSAVSAIQKLINVDNVDFILGGVCSSESVASSKIADAKGVLMISAISSSPELSVEDNYFFRFRNDAHASIGLADYLSQYENITLINETSDYAQALADKLAQEYKGNIVFREKFSSDEKDFSILANKIKDQKDNIDAIVFFPQTDATAALMIRALNENGLLEAYKDRIVSAYFFASDVFLSDVGDLAEGLVDVQLKKPKNDLGVEYIDYMSEKYGIKTLDYLVSLEKESIALVEDALLDGVRTSKELKAYLQAITPENPREGYFGTYYFDKYGDAVGLEYQMQKIVNGVSVPFE